jgi:cobalamin biosynthesis Mg chelatase CobN
MEKEKLSAREAALVAAARREAEARKAGVPATPPAAAPEAPRAQAQHKPSPVERMAQLMAEERAETARRKKKMRRYGLIISAAILAAFALWLMRVFSRRR